MSLARVKNWIAGEVLTASDLNTEFTNILNNPGSLICPIGFNLTFTDATYDIGASGATRPRDLYLSRNAVVGGTLAVSGVSTLTGQAGIAVGTTGFNIGNTGSVRRVTYTSGTTLFEFFTDADAYASLKALNGTFTGALAVTGAITETTGAGWTSYTPAISADTGTWTSTAITIARYRILGKTLFIHLRVVATVNTGAPTQLQVAYPLGLTDNGTNMIIPTLINDNGAAVTNGYFVESGSTYMIFRKNNGTAFTGVCSVFFSSTVVVA